MYMNIYYFFHFVLYENDFSQCLVCLRAFAEHTNRAKLWLASVLLLGAE